MSQKKVSCPTCRKLLEYDVGNPWRPFCGERCKTRDIANWASDHYRIAGKEAVIDEHGELIQPPLEDEDDTY